MFSLTFFSICDLERALNPTHTYTISLNVSANQPILSTCLPPTLILAEAPGMEENLNWMD